MVNLEQLFCTIYIILQSDFYPETKSSTSQGKINEKEIIYTFFNSPQTGESKKYFSKGIKIAWDKKDFGNKVCFLFCGTSCKLTN